MQKSYPNFPWSSISHSDHCLHGREMPMREPYKLAYTRLVNQSHRHCLLQHRPQDASLPCATSEQMLHLATIKPRKLPGLQLAPLCPQCQRGLTSPQEHHGFQARLLHRQQEVERRHLGRGMQDDKTLKGHQGLNRICKDRHGRRGRAMHS